MGNVDLDAVRAARHELNGVGPTVTFGGVTFELPNELPFTVVESVRQMGVAQAADDGFAVSEIINDMGQYLFGARYEEFLALGPSMSDMSALLENIAPMYGMNAGESAASED
jgi:hypothetical protein